jgi:hypothetical protein
MKTFRWTIFAGFFCVILNGHGAEGDLIAIPPGSEILGRLRKEHPRLLMTTTNLAELNQRVRTDPQLKEWHEKLRGEAGRVLDEPASRYEIPDGRRLLATSRRVLGRIFTLALLYRLDGDERYLERAWKELDAAANFKDWNPSHFLDTAEMTHAFAIGYDWLYDSWNAQQRALLRRSMLEKGVMPALQAYRREKPYGSWMHARHNWNQVCNGGIGMGALALGDEVPDLAGEFLQAALKSIQLPMKEFEPDGAWNEGPGYWNYATSYNVVFLAALESALGTDFGLSRMTGFSDTGQFPIYLTGPLGRTFNYADGGDSTIRAAQMFWLARKFDRPAYAEYEITVASPHALDLLWYENPSGPSTIRSLPLDKCFRGVEVATFRSGWEGRDALFVGLKAGDNKANHSNLDLGSFVLDALGVRWAVDLGADNYNMPGYFGEQRWTYYRLRAEGQNTLVINPGKDADQDPKAFARILRFDSKPQKACAIADLTEACAKHARRVWRGLALFDRNQVLIQDEVEAEKAAEVWWFMHTKAKVHVIDEKTSAILSEGSGRLWAKILSPANATFDVMDARPLPTSPNPSEQAKNDGVRKLVIHLSGVKDARLAVLLAPLREGEQAPRTDLKLVTLRDW